MAAEALETQDSRDECGCQTGAAAGFAALLVFAISVVAFGPWAGGWALTGLTGFLAFALAVGLGKQVGIARARREAVRV